MMDAGKIQGIVDATVGPSSGVTVLTVVEAADGTVSRVSFGRGSHRALVRLSGRPGDWLATAQTPLGARTLVMGRTHFVAAVAAAARHLADAVTVNGRNVGYALAEPDTGEEAPCAVQSFVSGEFIMPSADEVRRIAHGVAASMGEPPRPSGVSTADAGSLRVLRCALGLDDEASVDEMVEAVERLREVERDVEKVRSQAFDEAERLMAHAQRVEGQRDVFRDGFARVAEMLGLNIRDFTADDIERSVRGLQARADARQSPVRARRPRPSVCFKMPGDMNHADRRTFASCDDPTRHLDWSDDDG